MLCIAFTPKMCTMLISKYDPLSGLSTLNEWQQYVVSFTSLYNQREKWKLVAQSLFEIPWLYIYIYIYISHGSSVHGLVQANILEWVAISFSRWSSQSRDWTRVSSLQAESLLFEPSGKHKHHSFYLFPMYRMHHWTLLIYDQKIKPINSYMSKLTLCKVQSSLDNRITSIWTPNMTWQ